MKLTFNTGPKMLVGRRPGVSCRVRFTDRDTGKCVYEVNLPEGHNRATPNPKYYTNWGVVVREDDVLVFTGGLELEGKDVLVKLGSKALGDTIAWLPYVEEFRKQHHCRMHVATFLNSFMAGAYPEIKFVPVSSSRDDYYAVYEVGAYDNDYHRNKRNWRMISVQNIAADVLGFSGQEIQPRVVRSEKSRPIEEKYVAISEFSTLQGKFWNRLNGWQEVVDRLNSAGFRVMSVSKEPTKLLGVIRANGKPLEETVNNIQHAEFFIGVGSGLAWLAWALDVPRVIISGFSEPYSEMSDCVRVINQDVCHGCYNDPTYAYERGNWNYCPRKKNFECSKEISATQVMNALALAGLVPLHGDGKFRLGGLVINARSEQARRRQDLNVVESILVDDEYGLEKLGLNEPKVIVDIGGHIGSFGLKAKSLWPNAMLIAFEPNVESALLYRQNLEDNFGVEGWEVFNEAISYDPKKVCLAEDKNATGGGILITPEEITPEGVMKMERVHSKARYDVTYKAVRSRTLEEALADVEKVDLLKMDCEGSELEILEQMSEATAAKIEHVVGEYHVMGGYDVFEKLFKSRFPGHVIKPIHQESHKLKNISPTVGEFRARKRSRQNVLYLVPHLSTGGMPQYLLGQVRKRIGRGDWCKVVEYTNLSDLYVVQKRALQRICPISTMREDKVATLKRLVEEYDPDVVHLQEFPERFLDPEASFWLYRINRPYEIVETSHSSKPVVKSHIPDRYEFVSDYHRQMFKNSGVPIEVVEHQEAFHGRLHRPSILKELGLDPAKVHVLNVGLFTPGKNQGQVFEVARRLPEMQFHFVGNQAPNFRSYWEALMANKPSNCVVWGERDDLFRFYGAMDAFLFTSNEELSPIVIKEALSWSMPVVMKNLPTYCGAYDNVPGVTLLDPGVDEEALMKAVVNVATLPDLK